MFIIIQKRWIGWYLKSSIYINCLKFQGIKYQLLRAISNLENGVGRGGHLTLPPLPPNFPSVPEFQRKRISGGCIHGALCVATYSSQRGCYISGKKDLMFFFLVREFKFALLY